MNDIYFNVKFGIYISFSWKEKCHCNILRAAAICNKCLNFRSVIHLNQVVDTSFILKSMKRQSKIAICTWRLQ